LDLGSDWHHLLLECGEVQLACHLAFELGSIVLSEVGGNSVLLEQLQGNAQIVIADGLVVAVIVFAAVLHAFADGTNN